MTSVENAPSEVFFYWASLIVILIVLTRYRRQIIAWFLMKLYEFLFSKICKGTAKQCINCSCAYRRVAVN